MKAQKLEEEAMLASFLKLSKVDKDFSNIFQEVFTWGPGGRMKEHMHGRQ